MYVDKYKGVLKMKKVISITTIVAISAFVFASQANLTLEKVTQNELNLVLNADSDIYGLQFDLSYDPQKIRLSVFIVHSCHVLNIFSFFCGKTYYCLG